MNEDYTLHIQILKHIENENGELLVEKIFRFDTYEELDNFVKKINWKALKYRLKDIKRF